MSLLRAVTVTVDPPEDVPVARLFGRDSPVRRERIYNLMLLEDGSLVLLGRLRGDLAYARRILAEAPEVLGFSLSGGDEDGGSGEGDRGEDGRASEGSGLVFVHARPPPAVGQLLDLRRRHGVFFEFPIEATDSGRYRITMVGETNEELTALLEEVPPAVGFTVERIGPYVEDPRSLTELLTDRQREVLKVALEAGYYEVPRRATHRDLAADLGVAPPTVSEHLGKIEARIFGAIAGD